MSDTENNKTSDEILNELYHSLNLPPVSPEKKAKKERKNVGSKKEKKKSGHRDKSPMKKRKSSHSNSRSRSRSKSSHRYSKSRVKSASKSKSSFKDRSRSKSKNSFKDRSRSRSKNSFKNRSRSKSVSHSRSKYRSSRSKNRDRSFSRSRSKSRYSHSHSPSRKNKNSKSKRSYSRSRSRSRDRRGYKNSNSKYSKGSKYSRSRSRENRSRHRYSKDYSDDDYYHSKRKKDRSYSHSMSPKNKKGTSPSEREIIKDPLDAWKEEKLAKLKKISKGDVDTNPLEPLVISIDETESEIKTSLDSLKSLNDLSTIPLPNLSSETQASIKVSDTVEGAEKDVNDAAIQNSAEAGKDEDKPKGIVIKSLKDSLVFQQAEEEAKKKIQEAGIVKLLEDSKSEVNSASKAKLIPNGQNGAEGDTESKNKKEKKRNEKQDSKSKESKIRHKSNKKDRRRSRSRSRPRKRSKSRSPSRKSTRNRKKRSKSCSREKSPDCVESLRDKVTRKRLLEIARRNAVYLMKNNCLPPSIEKESVKATGKTVEELTNFCQQLVTKGDYSDSELNDPSLSEEEGDGEKPFSGTRHPFAIKDSKPILMNIRNAPMLPTKTNAERLADASKLREQFPVSSGSQHRNKEWVPVEKEEKAEPAETEEEETTVDKVFPEADPQVDLSQVVSTRLSAMRRLQANPNDLDAMRALNTVENDMANWVLSKQVPGKFTGTTGAKILTQEELSAGYQAWARKEQFKEATPISSQFGLKMMQKMGWTPGEGLGKNKEGQLEPLLLDVKLDKKGLHSNEEVASKRAPIPLARKLAGKHPVSALVELCIKSKWNPPEFEIVFDTGPDHKKNFLMKVIVNGQEYKPSIVTSTKKLAKANAAAACLQALGLIPRESTMKAQSTLQTIPAEAPLVVEPIAKPNAKTKNSQPMGPPSLVPASKTPVSSISTTNSNPPSVPTTKGFSSGAPHPPIPSMGPNMSFQHIYGGMNPPPLPPGGASHFAMDYFNVPHNQGQNF